MVVVYSEPVGSVASLLDQVLVFPVQAEQLHISAFLVSLCSVVVLIHNFYELLSVICPSDSVLVSVPVHRVLALVLVHHIV